MRDIPMSEVTPEFVRCRQAAGMHIERLAGGRLDAWLRAHLNPPSLEHLSFRLGNQFFSSGWKTKMVGLKGLEVDKAC
jgi:hypothetical protein